MKVSITTKVLLPVIVLVVVGTTVLVGSIYFSTSRQVIDTNIRHATATIEQFRALRGYYTDNVVKKVKAGSTLKISYDHAQNEKTIPLPATMIHDLSAMLSTNGTQIHLYSAWPFPVRKDRVLDRFMQEAVAYFATNGAGAFTRSDSVAGSTRVRVAVADRMVNDSCVKCHNAHPESPKQDWKLGDVRGVLEVSLPADKELAANRSLLARNAAGAIAGLAVIVAVLIWIVRRSVIAPVQRNAALLEDCSRGLSTTAAAVSAAGQALAEGAGSQAASLEETSASLEEISSMTKRNADNAREAEKSAAAARLAATESSADMETMNSAMQAMQDSSGNIARIIKTIDEIAFQTNILALNAAVEAARAGESGAGFAVVADEVRNLAQRSAMAARETAESIDDSIDKSKAGAEVSVRIAHRLAEIMDKVSKVDTLVAEISRACAEQSQGISQVAAAVSQVDQVTQSNAASAEENANAGKELQRQASELRDAVQGLYHEVSGRGGDIQVSHPAAFRKSTAVTEPVTQSMQESSSSDPWAAANRSSGDILREQPRPTAKGF